MLFLEAHHLVKQSLLQHAFIQDFIFQNVRPMLAYQVGFQTGGYSTYFPDHRSAENEAGH